MLALEPHVAQPGRDCPHQSDDSSKEKSLSPGIEGVKRATSDLKDVLFLACNDGVDLLNRILHDFFNLLFPSLYLICARPPVRLYGREEVDGIVAALANRHFAFFAVFSGYLDEFLPAFLSERWERYADQITV